MSCAFFLSVYIQSRKYCLHMKINACRKHVNTLSLCRNNFLLYCLGFYRHEMFHLNICVDWLYLSLFLSLCFPRPPRLPLCPLSDLQPLPPWCTGVRRAGCLHPDNCVCSTGTCLVRGPDSIFQIQHCKPEKPSGAKGYFTSYLGAVGSCSSICFETDKPAAMEVQWLGVEFPRPGPPHRAVGLIFSILLGNVPTSPPTMPPHFSFFKNFSFGFFHHSLLMDTYKFFQNQCICNVCLCCYAERWCWGFSKFDIYLHQFLTKSVLTAIVFRSVHHVQPGNVLLKCTWSLSLFDSLLLSAIQIGRVWLGKVNVRMGKLCRPWGTLDQRLDLPAVEVYLQ